MKKPLKTYDVKEYHAGGARVAYQIRATSPLAAARAAKLTCDPRTERLHVDRFVFVFVGGCWKLA